MRNAKEMDSIIGNPSHHHATLAIHVQVDSNEECYVRQQYVPVMMTMTTVGTIGAAARARDSHTRTRVCGDHVQQHHGAWHANSGQVGTTFIAPVAVAFAAIRRDQNHHGLV